MTLSRTDGRGHDTARPVAVQLGFQRFPEGSVNARVEERLIELAEKRRAFAGREDEEEASPA